ncbi:ThiJ/PfpI family protein [Phlyctochytrium arcticum]|nr:ThiJ/PfpI family protein [Phlyctochytrium arcticum]
MPVTHSKKVLIILSAADHIDVHKKDGSIDAHPTGFFLKEVGMPLLRLLQAGYEPIFANPSGEEPKMDPMSDSAIWFLSSAELQKEKSLIDSMKIKANFSHPKTFASITTEELATFAGVFVPGGHAPVTDLGTDPNLGRILTYFHTAQKPTAVICHGPIALLSALGCGPNQSYPYQGYKVTCYANKEEVLNDWMWGGKVRKVEDALREAGLDVQVAPLPLMPKVVVDRELVSGQGPTSVDQLGAKFVEMLEAS